MTWHTALTGIAVPIFVFAAFSSSTNYQIKSYDLGEGASNSSSSTNYHQDATVGEPAGTSSSTNFKSLSSSIQAQQANVPAAPTLGNGGSTYYNQLTCILNIGSNPSDYTYAIDISSNNFVTNNYVQATGALGSTAVYQSYTLWGGSSGFLITGLVQNTSYEVKVSAMQGQFTNSAYGPYASISTVPSSITFSLTPNTENMGNLTSGTVISSPSNLSMGLTTNADFGGNIYIAGTNGGLKSTKNSFTIATGSMNLATQSSGFGVQGLTASQASGGPLTIDSPYNGSASNVGSTATAFEPIFTTTGPIVGGAATAVIMAKASSTTPAGADYQEILTLIASASF